MKSEMSPMLNLLEFGEFHPGVSRPLLGVGSSEPTGWLGGHFALINFGQLPNACIMSSFSLAKAMTHAACRCPLLITYVYSLNFADVEIFGDLFFGAALSRFLGTCRVSISNWPTQGSEEPFR